MDGTAGHASATAASAASTAIIICVASQRGAFTQASGACSATHMSLQRGSTSYSSSAVVQSIYQPVPVVVPLPRPNVGSGNAVVHSAKQGNVAPANGQHAERQIERRAACAGGFTDGALMVHCLGSVIVLHS